MLVPCLAEALSQADSQRPAAFGKKGSFSGA